MDNLHLVRELETLLRNDSRYTTEDGTPLKNRIVEDALALRPELLRHLLGHPKLRAHFFADVDGLAVFDKVKFQRFVMNKQFLADSYTAFKNRIGLTTDDGRFLSDSREVVLSWPYKDCLLEGGQTKEDAKRDETFWNETLAPEEVARLTEPKALTAFRRYDKDGAHEVEQVSLADNLVIKGNNLLVLHSLKKKYSGRVKLIYLDPPYYFTASKKEDTFNYNSNFKLSTWCSFMKSRLEIARELLSEDGAIFVQISDDGVAELHLIMKEVFNKNGENNFINKITIKTKSPSGFASVNPGVFETAEYILAFAKHKSRWKFHQQYVESSYDANYKFCVTNINEPCSIWKIERVKELVAQSLGFKNSQEALNNTNKHVFYMMVADYALENRDKVFRLTAVNDNAAQEVVEKRDESKDRQGKILKIERKDDVLYLLDGQELSFYKKKVRSIDGELCPSIQLSNIWIDTPYEGIAKEGGVKLKGGKKPEKLIRRIVELASNEGDLILDFFAGSGTTAAVAQKLKRHFITCDQLDSQVDMCLQRLRSVVAGDKTGISKAVGWQGGGSFVYCELAKANMQFAEEIERATNSAMLKAIWERMVATGYLNYRVDVATVNAEAESLEALPMEDQKRFMVECLDKNLLYIPLSDLDSDEFTLSDSDRRLTRMFYAKNR